MNQDFDMSKAEIIVVDNGSKDKTAMVAKKYKVKVISEPKKGLRFARQAGLVAAKGELVACSDADTILPKDWLKKAFSCLSHKDVVVYSPSFRFVDGKNKIVFPIIFYSFIDFLKKTLFALNKPAFSSWGYVFKKKPFLSVGGYDLDTDLCEDLRTGIKLKKIGKCVFDHSTVVLTSVRRVKKETANGNRIPMIYDTIDDLVRVVIFEKMPSLTRKHYH